MNTPYIYIHIELRYLIFTLGMLILNVIKITVIMEDSLFIEKKLQANSIFKWLIYYRHGFHEALSEIKIYHNTVEPIYKGHPRWWPFKRGGLSWGVE